MALTVGTDTYLSLADATAYVAANYISTDTEYTTWSALTDGNKEIYLKKATKKIDRQIFRGKKADLTQTLEFPRSFISTSGIKSETAFFLTGWTTQSEVPQEVKDAEVEEAISMALGAGQDIRRKLQREGVKSFSLGKLSETYSGSSGKKDLISNEAKELLKHYLNGGFRTC